MEGRAKVLKKEWQRLINEGAVTDRATLICMVEARGFKLTRNGRDYIGFMDSFGERGRVRFLFEASPLIVNEDKKTVRRNERRKRRLDASPGGWIYVLSAMFGEEQVFYIGQTTNFVRRMRDHARRYCEADRSSGKLFEWAAENGCEVMIAVLELVGKDADQRHNYSAQAAAESKWFNRAKRSGAKLPGWQTWGASLKSRIPMQGDWPLIEIAAAAKPIEEVVSRRIKPEDLMVKLGSIESLKN